MPPVTPKRVGKVCGVLAAILLVATLISLKLGPIPFSITGLVAAAWQQVFYGTPIPTDYMMSLDIRLPRALLAMLVGAALSVAGAGFQALLRNPLADPYVLGVSSGAAIGAIVSLILGWDGVVALPLAAFLGAAATITAVYFLGRREGQIDSHALLLAGIVSASFLTAVTMFLLIIVPGRDLRGMVFWLMGDISTTSSTLSNAAIGWLFFLVLAGVFTIYSTAADLNLLLTGEQEAMHLGVDVRRVKLVVYLTASLLTGVAVSVSGTIGFVGLLAPHIMRLFFGGDHRLLIPASALGGAIAIVVADTLARTVAPPTELPVGAMTAMAGAPMFIYLLRRRMG